MPDNMKTSSAVDIAFRIPAQLGEGVCWHPIRQTLWWVDILGRRIFEAGLNGDAVRTLECSQMIGAVAPTRDGSLIGALHDGVYFIDADSGATTPFASPPQHDPRYFRFNDAKVDPLGRFWAGSLALDGRAGQSRLYRIDPDGTTTVMREGVTISNGLAWSPAGDVLYYIDSATLVVQAFPFSVADGTLGSPEVVLQFERNDGLPDGCAMDAEGHLWIAHWGGAKVTRWDVRRRRLRTTVPLPVRHVTSCAFGGERRDQLFITTAVGSDQGVPEPEAGWVFHFDPGTLGLEQACFART